MFVSIKHELTANARNTIVELNDVSYWIWTPTVWLFFTKLLTTVNGNCSVSQSNVDKRDCLPTGN